MFFSISYIGNGKSSQLTNSYFSRWLKPPSRITMITCIVLLVTDVLEFIYICLFICINYDVFLFHGRPKSVGGFLPPGMAVPSLQGPWAVAAAVHPGRVDSSTSLGHSALGVYESMSKHVFDKLYVSYSFIDIFSFIDI